VFVGKPIIGIAGGIGSGKSFVARIFGEMGCLVLDADEQVKQAYKTPQVKQTLRKWWGNLIFGPDGEIDRAAVARKVFTRPDELRRLEQLLHPLIRQVRQQVMKARAHDPQVLAFVLDAPLLFEAELNKECDAVVFVEAPVELRVQRVGQARGWQAAELESREKLQMPLDNKRRMSDHVVDNAASADQVRAQVREVLSRIFAGLTPKTGLG